MSFLTVACARARMPLLVVGVVLVVVGDRVGTALVWVGVGCMLLGLATYFRLVPAQGSPLLIRPPVSGSWVAVNSPAERVPSHGILAYGQSHAVDLVHVPTTGPEAGRRPGERAGRSWHPRPESFSGFGRPVLAVADGEVVRVSGAGNRMHAPSSAGSASWCSCSSPRSASWVGPARSSATT